MIKNKKTLIFLAYIEDPSSVAAYFKNFRRSISHKNCTIVSMNRFMGEVKELAGFEIIYFEDLLKKEDYEYISDHAFTAAGTWYKAFSPEGGLTEFKNINMLEIFELETCLSLTTVLKNFQIILNAVNGINPSEMLFISEKEEDGLDGISVFSNLTLKIKTRHIKIRNNAPNMVLSRLKRWIKGLTSDILTDLLAGFERAYLVRSKKYRNIALMEYRFPHMIENIEREYPAINYVTGKGFNLRLDYLKNKKPLLSFLTMDKVIIGGKEKIFFKKIEGALKNYFSEKESLRYMGHDIYDILRSIFKDNIEKKLSFVRKNMAMLYRVLGIIKPKIIIMRDSVRRCERVLASIGKSLNIPTIVIQHGMMTIEGIYTKQYVTSMALWGDVYMKCYESSGTNISRSKITGYPLHDAIYAKREGRIDRYRSILKGLGADPDKPTIIYLASCIRYYPIPYAYFSPDLSVHLLKVTVKMFEKFKDIQLIVKLHPYYTRDEYPKFEKEIVNLPNAFISKNADIPDLISGSAAVISELFSSTIMDAIILKKPVISYSFAEKEEIIPLEKRGVGFEIKHPEQLELAIKRVLSLDGSGTLSSDENFESFVRDYAHKIDGQSSRRVKDLIKELAYK